MAIFATVFQLASVSGVSSKGSSISIALYNDKNDNNNYLLI